MLFCTADSPATYQRTEISFPNQVDVKVNGSEVHANFRGLKNKPGSTRPADITSLVRRTRGFKHEMVISYALTNKVRHRAFLGTSSLTGLKSF